MNATSAGAGLPFNPFMFKWARERCERSLEEAAKRLNTRPENIRAWESGDGSPTVRQARQLADLYERPFLEFFLPEPPRLPETRFVPDFRRYRTTESSHVSRELKAVQSWAEAMRDNALDLYASIGEAPPEYPPDLHATVNDSAEKAATLARDASGLTIEAQTALLQRDAASFSKIIRSALESLGILVLRDASLTKFGARGICLFSTPLPVIVFGAEAPSAQAFTMAHELAHVVLRQSGISGPVTSESDESPERKIEGWCNRFAAAYLVPAEAVNALWARPNAPVLALGDDTLQRFVTVFKVSRHAMLIRLVHLGYVAPEYYWDIKRPQLEEEERNYKPFGRPKYYGSRFRSACGDLYTGLVLEAWANGAISNHSAAEFMGTKSFKHLEDIRREFSPS